MPKNIPFDFSIPVSKKKLFGNLFIEGIAQKKEKGYDVSIRHIYFDNADVSKVIEVFGGMNRIINAAKKHAKILESFK